MGNPMSEKVVCDACEEELDANDAVEVIYPNTEREWYHEKCVVITPARKYPI